MDYFTFILAFLEGFGLIISPCILPILPIILSGSLEGKKQRPYGIIVGFVLMFAVFTFFSRTLVLHTGLDLEILRYISAGLLILFGLVMISSYLTEKFASLTARLSNLGSSSTLTQGGFLSGLLFGGLVAIIWTPCAGPLLAAVIVQTVLQKTTFASFLIMIFFAIGAGVPMLLIALFGRQLMARFHFFKKHAYLCRKILGILIILSVIYLFYGETALSAPQKSSHASSTALQLIDGVHPYTTPPIAGITHWINSPPLTLESLKGKVVLIDFWTYSCINCIRTLPFLKDWYQKYHDKGLVIIGVHTPEFDFEKKIENIQQAVDKFGIRYPVASDDQFVTWRNYNNVYWPAHYLIDKNGQVVYTHFGEGAYDVTENNIRYLLNIQNETPASSITDLPSFSFMQTPETYLGYLRANNFASRESIVKDKAVSYSFPDALSDDQWALRGSWIVARDKIIANEAGATLKIHFNAKKVFIVMGTSAPIPIQVKLLLNGEPVEVEKGGDVHQSEITVKEHRLYEAIVLKKSGEGYLQLIPQSPGLEIYTFTFG